MLIIFLKVFLVIIKKFLVIPFYLMKIITNNLQYNIIKEKKMIYLYFNLFVLDFI